MEVNYSALDDLVLDYLETEGLLQDNGNSGSPSKDQCKHVRHLVEQGDVSEAIELLQQVSTAVIKDQRLLFKLLKQKFVECVRRSTNDGDQQAVACAKEELAPLALDAYPEAYPEFKRLLLLLIYQGAAGQQRGSAAAAAVAQEWEPASRDDLAGQIYHTACQEQGIMDSTLALLLRYLHQVQAACQQATRMFAAAAPPLLQQVVPGTRDTAPLAPEHSSAAGFSESEVQAVMQGAGVGRQAALDAMKRTGGGAVPAFKQELMLLQLCSEQLDVLAWEYASHRGLLSAADAAPGQPPCAADEMEVDEGANPGSSPAADDGTAQEQQQEQEQEQEQQQEQQEQEQQPEGRPPGEAPEVLSPGFSGKRSKDLEHDRAGRHRTQRSSRTESQSPPYKQPRFHTSQGAGTAEATHTTTTLQPEQATAASTASACPRCQQEAGRHRRSAAQAAVPSQDLPARQATVARLRNLAKRRQWQGLLAAALELAPQLEQQRPALLFDLHRLQYMQIVESGDVAAALLLARQQLTPLADKHPELLPALKGTMAALLPAGFSARAGEAAQPDSVGVVDALVAVVQSSKGMQEPRLVGLLKELLASHAAWFRLQRCRDPFATELGIDRLTQPPPSALTPAAAAKPPAAADAMHDSSDEDLPGAGQGEGEAVAGAGGVAVAGGLHLSEEDILQVMEILELPRSMAIDLLEQNEGSVEGVVMQVLG